MDSEEIKYLLVRYITNQATDAETQEVKHWIGLHPENELYFIELYDAWQNMLYLKPDAIDEERAFEILKLKTGINKPTQSVRVWLGIAAAVFLLLSIGAVIYLKPNHIKNNQVTAKNGHLKKITLADNTIVWLNAGSKLNYDAGFNKTNRTVYLEGEAFFEIGHTNKLVPFLVKTKNYTIRDIGTSFNLKAYPNDPFFETTVIKGEVAVEDNSENGTQETVNRIYIKPHQVLKIFYNQKKENDKMAAVTSGSYNKVLVSEVDSTKMDVYDGWKDDLLVFDGATLGDISKILERRYDVQIILKSDELENIRYSGSFKNIPDINKVLQIIKQNTPIDYIAEGRTITINKTY